jgi:hypothetical protein
MMARLIAIIHVMAIAQVIVPVNRWGGTRLPFMKTLLPNDAEGYGSKRPGTGYFWFKIEFRGPFLWDAAGCREMSKI